MDLKLGGITKKLEDNAALLAFGAGAWSRIPNFNSLIGHFTNFGTGQAGGTYGALGEAINTLTSPELLKYKLLDSPHLYTALFKLGVGAYIAGELGIVAPRWKNLGLDIAKGAGAAAIVISGSGPGSPNRSVIDQASQEKSTNPFKGAYA